MIDAWIAVLDGPALSALTAEARKKAGREEIDRLMPDRARLLGCLKTPVPKVRKNAARLIGALGHGEDVPALLEALSAETTLFVLPSILLSLGSIGGEDARAALSGYTPPSPANEGEESHCREIREALQKARSALSGETDMPLYTLSAPRKLLAVSPEGFSPLLCEELTEKGFSPTETKAGAFVTTADLSALFTVRTMSEALLPLGREIPLSGKAIGKAVGGELTLPYRIELRNYPGDRAGLIRSVSQACGGENSPSHYGLELRIVAHGETCDLFLKPWRVVDHRYSYRVKTLPASIAPALAACLARLAMAQCTAERPVVLDPFAGSGTLLFECERLQDCASLTGVDLSRGAVSAALENTHGGNSKARFIGKDILRFIPREPADLVISNMPFGNRVGSHSENEPLYRSFVKKLPGMLSGGGVALLYTMEYRLLSGCLQGVPGLKIVDMRRTEAGGLLPWVFLLKRT